MIILDILLLIMTITCVVYCWMLNRRIQDLQNSRIEFARMIKELNASIVKAESNVHEMSELSKITNTEIKDVVSEAKQISSELLAISEFSSDLLSKLEKKSHEVQNTDQAETAQYDISAKSGEKFTEDDLAPIEEQEEGANYKSHLKNFIQNITTKKSETQNMSLNQSGYYDTLRKINAKK